MSLSLTKPILLLFISSILLSCNAQVDTNVNSGEQRTPSLGRVVTQLDSSIWKIFQDAKGTYWFGSNGKGLYKLDGKDLIQFTTSDGLVHNQIRGIQEDSAGNLYVETHAGISKYDGQAFTTLSPSRSPGNAWKLQASDLWFGYEANDIYRYDGEHLFELQLPRQDLEKAFAGQAFKLSFGGRDHNTYAVYGINKDTAGNIWIGTFTAGAFRYDGESFIWFGEKELSTLPDGRVPGVRSMIQDKDGYFWLSNFYSKYKINPALPLGYEKMRAVDLPKELTKDKILYFNAGLADKEGTLWMITYNGGVWKYDGNSLSNFEVKNGAENVLLVSIYEDASGTIWLGTDNDGVYRQHGESFEKFEVGE